MIAWTEFEKKMAQNPPVGSILEFDDFMKRVWKENGSKSTAGSILNFGDVLKNV